MDAAEFVNHNGMCLLMGHMIKNEGLSMIEKQTFCSLTAPFVCSIVQEYTVEETMANILNSEHDGAKAFVIDLSYLPEEGRSMENMRKIFSTCNRPMMPILYRTGTMTLNLVSDERRAEVMLQTLDAGATSVDIMGDMFEPSARFELAMSREAVSAQKDLARRVHEKGGEVLISSHMPEPRRAEDVLEHMLIQVERGADIAKVICGCNTDEEMQESLRTLFLLKEKMPVPFIYLCNGKLGRLQRFFAPMLGSMLNFGIQRYSALSLQAQPTVAAAKSVMEEMSWHLG